MVGQVMRAVCLLLLLGCTRTDPDKCERAIRNFAHLVYWGDAEKEIAAAPADRREALRKEKLAKFERDLEKGITLDVSKCTSANFSDQVDCMIAAKTAAQAKSCQKD